MKPIGFQKSKPIGFLMQAQASIRTPPHRRVRSGGRGTRDGPRVPGKGARSGSTAPTSCFAAQLGHALSAGEGVVVDVERDLGPQDLEHHWTRMVAVKDSSSSLLSRAARRTRDHAADIASTPLCWVCRTDSSAEHSEGQGLNAGVAVSRVHPELHGLCGCLLIICSRQKRAPADGRSLSEGWKPPSSLSLRSNNGSNNGTLSTGSCPSGVTRSSVSGRSESPKAATTHTDW